MAKLTPAHAQLLADYQALQSRLAEAEETLRAIHAGEVDAFVLANADRLETVPLPGTDSLYRAMVESMNEGAVTLTLDGTLFFSNPRFAEMVGVPQAQLAGTRFEHWLVPGERAAFGALLDTARETSARGEFMLAPVPPAAHIPVQLSVHPLDARATPGLAIVITDLTAQKASETRLRENEQKLRTIIELLPVGIAILDRQRQVVQLNPALVRILDLSAERLLQGELDGRTYFSPEGKPLALEELPSWRALEQQHEVHEEEVGFLRADGAVRWLLVSAAPLSLADLGAVIVTTDITGRKQAEQDVADSQERFRLLNELISDFAYAARIEPDGTQRLEWWTGALGEAFLHPVEPGDAPGNLTAQVEAEDLPVMRAHLARVMGGTADVCEVRFKHRGGEARWLRHYARPAWDAAHTRVIRIYGAAQDIQARKEAERALLESERRFRALIEHSADAISLADAEGKILYASPAAHQILGLADGQLVGRNSFSGMHPDDLERARADFFALVQTPGAHAYNQFRLRHFDGSWRWVEGIGTNMLAQPGVHAMVANYRDITGRKRAEQDLQSSEERFRTLFEQAVDGIFITDPQGRFIEVNPSACAMLGYSRAELLKLDLRSIHAAEDLAQALPNLDLLVHGGTVQREQTYRRKDGTTFPIELTARRVSDGRIQSIVRDITERKRAETALRESERFSRDTLNALTAQLAVLNEEGTIIAVNAAWIQYTDDTGYADDAMEIHANYLALCDRRAASGSAEAAQMAAGIRGVLGGAAPFELDYASFAPEDHRWFRARVKRFESEGPLRVVVTHADITASTLAALEIRRRTNELLELFELSRALAGANDLEQVLDLISRHAVAIVHCTFARLALVEGDELVMRAAYPIRTLELDLAVGTRTPRRELALTEWVLGQPDPLLLNSEEMHLNPVEADLLLLGHSRTLCLVPLTVGGNTPSTRNSLGLLMLGEVRSEAREPFSPEKVRMARSIGDQAATAIRQMLLKSETAQRLQRLASLHMVDRAISGSFDLGIIFRVGLAQLGAHSGVDAAAIHLYEAFGHSLVLADGIGFRTNPMTRTPVRLGEGLAGRAALERQAVTLQLDASRHPTGPGALWAKEEFLSAVGVPLVVKGKLKGVLEVFQRRAFHPDAEWLEFLNTLAGQLAIAIETGELLADLHRSNADLALAYEATIEGWSRALDLRDNETEGHTLRVTDMAVQLARRVGFDDAALVHIRRGALLHDIGKMGVPDDILRKPGALTPDEWTVMKRHPRLAYEMLEPIAFLKPALDIPYCHHEKWNGSGYPRGLAGEAIPLAARVFAVVDVWDALTSDRTYRPAWSQADALAYLRAEAGKHFEPRIVELFLEETERRRRK